MENAVDKPQTSEKEMARFSTPEIEQAKQAHSELLAEVNQANKPGVNTGSSERRAVGKYAALTQVLPHLALIDAPAPGAPEAKPPSSVTDAPASPQGPDNRGAEQRQPVPPLKDMDDSDAHSGIKLQPGDLRENEQILVLSGGSQADGVKVIGDKNASIRSQLHAPDGVAKDMPVAAVPGMEPGTLGLLALHDRKGQEHLVPFVAAAMPKGKGIKQEIAVNDAAAKDLGLGQGKHKSTKASHVDVIALAADGSTLPATAAGLKDAVSARIQAAASRPEVLEQAEKALEGKEVIQSAYIPKPDTKFGYRRTDRSDAELSKIRSSFEKEAKKEHELSEKVKPGSEDGPATVQKILKEAKSERQDLVQEQNNLSQLKTMLKNGDASQLSDDFIHDLPSDLAIDLAKAKYNRDAARQNLEAANNPLQTLFGLDEQQKANFTNQANLALQCAQTQEARALKNADNAGNELRDEIETRDGIIADTTDPEAQAILQHKFAMKAMAAEVMAANPDLSPGKYTPGALEGARIVINGGHDPYHGSRTPGFDPYDWNRTKDNPAGMSEYDFNKETSEILGALVEYSGGVPIYVNQDALYKTNPAAQNMVGLAAAMESHNADIMISNHMDDDKNIKPGTLTLVNSKSHRLGALINQGKGVIGLERADKPLREQPTGVQAFVHSDRVVLNELLTTAPEDRSRIMNPHELARMQLGVVVGMERFLHPVSRARQAREQAADAKSTVSWSDYWAKADERATIEQPSLPYPKHTNASLPRHK